MQLKNILCALMVIIGTQTIHATEDQSSSTSKRDIAIKAAKIAGYSAELATALFAYSALQLIGWDLKFASQNKDGHWQAERNMRIPTLKSIATNYKEKEYKAMGNCIAFQVPFIASAGHALYGLGSELAPLVQAAFAKIKTHKTK